MKHKDLLHWAMSKLLEKEQEFCDGLIGDGDVSV